MVQGLAESTRSRAAHCSPVSSGKFREDDEEFQFETSAARVGAICFPVSLNCFLVWRGLIFFILPPAWTGSRRTSLSIRATEDWSRTMNALCTRSMHSSPTRIWMRKSSLSTRNLWFVASGTFSGSLLNYFLQALAPFITAMHRRARSVNRLSKSLNSTIQQMMSIYQANLFVRKTIQDVVFGQDELDGNWIQVFEMFRVLILFLQRINCPCNWKRKEVVGRQRP